RNQRRSTVKKVSFCVPLFATRMSRRRRAFDRLSARALAAMIVLFAGIPLSFAASDNNEHGTRVESWAVGHITPLPAATAQYSNQTLRAIVHTSVGGDEVRVRIANTFGTAPLVIGAAHVASSSSGASIVPGTDRVLPFGGRTSVTIPAGAPAVSVPVDLHVEAVADIAVSIYLPNATKGETTTLFQGASYVSSAGNFASSVDLPGATPLAEWPFVSGLR